MWFLRKRDKSEDNKGVYWSYQSEDRQGSGNVNNSVSNSSTRCADQLQSDDESYSMNTFDENESRTGLDYDKWNIHVIICDTYIS